MKKYFLTILIFSFITLNVSSCENNNNPKNPSNLPKDNDSYTEDEIMGTWRMVNVTFPELSEKDFNSKSFSRLYHSKIYKII